MEADGLVCAVTTGAAGKTVFRRIGLIGRAPSAGRWSFIWRGGGGAGIDGHEESVEEPWKCGSLSDTAGINGKHYLTN